MCGLAGVALIGGEHLSVEADSLLSAMATAVGHRGPDGEQIYREGPVGLVFRRLALVGPTSGDQPLFSDDGSTVLIANGEVYNHRDIETGELAGVRMRTKSDCEVLAHLYAREGLRFLDGVNGMFAIALWDRRRNRLVFARDRFGIKPIYYAKFGRTVVFGSEIKSLFAHPECPRQLDWERSLGEQMMTLSPYLTQEPVTAWFRGVELVPAGSIVTIDLNTGEVEQYNYWDLPAFDGTGDATDEELVAAYRKLLANSVNDCATADAELGLFLSGGVDSAAVAAFAASAGPEIHTFTVLNGGTLANGDAEFGRRVATELGMPHHMLHFDADRTPGVEEWKRLLWLLETPLCNAEQYFKYELHRYAKHVRPELRGMLLGQASDEYNGGYSTVYAIGDGWAGFEAGILQMARRTVLHGAPTLAPWWEHEDSALLNDDVLVGHAKQIMADPYSAYVAWKHRTVQQYNCWHEDRTAAGNGVEARVPFLDHRIIELLATIPAARRASLLTDKRILRDAVRGLLPEDVVRRPKVSFFYGDGQGFVHRMVVRMLAQDDGALVEEALSAPGADGFLNPDGMRAMIGGLREQVEPFDVEFLLRVVNLGLLDRMARDLPKPPIEQPRPELAPAVRDGDWDAAVAGMHRFPLPSQADVLAFAEDVLLVASPSDSDTLYVAVNGQFEYVATADADPAWCAVLRAVDGRRTLGEILAVADVPLDAVAGVLHDSVDAGVLQVAGGVPCS